MDNKLRELLIKNNKGANEKIAFFANLSKDFNDGGINAILSYGFIKWHYDYFIEHNITNTKNSLYLIGEFTHKLKDKRFVMSRPSSEVACLFCSDNQSLLEKFKLWTYDFKAPVTESGTDQIVEGSLPIIQFVLRNETERAVEELGIWKENNRTNRIKRDKEIFVLEGILNRDEDKIREGLYMFLSKDYLNST